MKDNKFNSYKELISLISSKIEELKDDAIKDLYSQYFSNDSSFKIGIVGEFRRGKSTLINALLGEKIVPSSVLPTSATLNYIKWGKTKKATIKYKDGKIEDISFEHLSDYITKLTSESREISSKIEYAEIEYPSFFCSNGIEIIDTPGLNDDEQMSLITNKVIPTLDAIIMVLSPDSPFSETESDFIQKVLKQHIHKVLFVLNKIDNLEKDDEKKLIKHIKERICEKIKEIKKSEVLIYPISASLALNSKIEDDKKLFKKSFFDKFEQAIKDYLITKCANIRLQKFSSLLNEYKAKISNDIILENQKNDEKIKELDDLLASSLKEKENLKIECNQEIEEYIGLIKNIKVSRIVSNDLYYQIRNRVMNFISVYHYDINAIKKDKDNYKDVIFDKIYQELKDAYFDTFDTVWENFIDFLFEKDNFFEEDDDDLFDEYIDDYYKKWSCKYLIVHKNNSDDDDGEFWKTLLVGGGIGTAIGILGGPLGIFASAAYFIGKELLEDDSDKINKFRNEFTDIFSKLLYEIEDIHPYETWLKDNIPTLERFLADLRNKAMDGIENEKLETIQNNEHKKEKLVNMMISNNSKKDNICKSLDEIRKIIDKFV